MTTKVTGYAFVQSPEGLRVAYKYAKIDADGNIVANNLRGSFVDESEETKTFLEALSRKILTHIE